MASTKSKKSRKVAAVVLAVAGVAGLSLASASQINLTGSQFQAGVVSVDGCQTSTVPVTFAAPTLSGGAYVSTGITLSSIDAACATAPAKKYKVAVSASGLSTPKEYSGTISGTSIAVTIPTADIADLSNVTKVALTIY